jgi:RNA polymerase sigma-70 factor (ECF subfamily)
MKEPDEILVQRARQGDQAAFGSLVDKYKSATVGLAFSIVGNFEDAKDLAQEAFLKAYLHLTDLRDTSKFSAWLNTITRSNCFRWLRDNKRGRFFSLEKTLLDDKETADEIMIKRSPKTPEQSVLARELRENIFAALSKLSEKNRLTTVLYFMDGLSYKEIADFEGVPVSTVKGRLYHARKQLKQELITMVEQTLKKQAPDSEFTGSVMDILSKIEESANRIQDVKYTKEDTYFPSWPKVCSVEQKSPDKYREESGDYTLIRNGDRKWRYDNHLRLLEISELKSAPKSAWASYLPSGFSLPLKQELEDGLSIAEQDEMTITLQTEAEDSTARRYYHRQWYFPRGNSLPDDALITYSVRTWEEQNKDLPNSLGVDAESYVPLFVERLVKHGRLRVEVKKIRSFPGDIVLPVEFEIKGPIKQYEIRYKDIQINQGIPDERFLFEPPGDAIVMDESVYSDVDAGIAQYEGRLKSEPENVHLYYALVCLYERQAGRYRHGSLAKKEVYAKALKNCQKAIQLKPDVAELYRILGRVYWGLGMWSEAADASYKFHELQKRYRADDALMEMLQRAGRNKELIELYKYMGRVGEASNLVALWKKEYGDLASLVQEYEEKLRQCQDEGSNDTHAILAYSYYELGDRQKAIEHFRTLQEKRSHLAYEHWFQLGLYQEMAQILEELLKKEEEAQKTRSRALLIRCRLLWVCVRTGQFDKVANLYENIVRHGRGMQDDFYLPNVFWTYGMRLGIVNSDDLRMLLQEIGTAVQHRKGREASMLYLLVGDSHILEHKERFFGEEPDMESAIRSYQRAVELDSKNDLAYAALGNARFAQKDYATAAASYQQAVNLDEDQPYYQSQLAYAYNGVGEHDKAIDIGRKLVQEAPEDCDMRAISGTTYFNAGEYRKAIEEYEQAQKLYEEWGGWIPGPDGGISGTSWNRTFLSNILAKAYELVGTSKRP